MEDSNHYFLKEINHPRDMWIKALSSQKLEKTGDLQNKKNNFSNKIKLLMIYLREKDCTSK